MEVIEEAQKEETMLEEEEFESEIGESNFIVFLQCENYEDCPIDISDVKPCEFQADELISMHVKQDFSFVLTQNHEVLVFGTFMNLD